MGRAGETEGDQATVVGGWLPIESSKDWSREGELGAGGGYRPRSYKSLSVAVWRDGLAWTHP